MVQLRVSHAYRQLPFNSSDWPYVCFKEGGAVFMDTILPFGLRWTAASCQNATSIITSHLNRLGLSLLVYIFFFCLGEGGLVQSKHLAEQHFTELQGTLDNLGLVEAKHN